MTKPKQCSNCSQPTWRGPYRLCKTCRRKADLKNSKLPEIRLLIALEMDPVERGVVDHSTLIKLMPGFENSTEAAAIEALKRRPKSIA